MNPGKLKLYMEVAAMSLNGGGIYLFILSIATGEPSGMVTGLTALNLAIMWKFNDTFHQLKDKWRGKGE